MKKKKEKKEKKYAKKYKEMKAESNIVNTLAKTGIDLLLGATLGAGVSAASGRLSLPIGLALLASSHYFDEQTGVIRTTGTAAIAYGIAKAIANQNLAEQQSVDGFSLAGETSKAKVRMESFKDELFAAFFINKFLKKKEQPSDQTESEPVGAIDLSSLDFFEEQLEQQAADFQEQLPDDFASAEDMAIDLELESAPDDYPDQLEDEPEMYIETADDFDLTNI